jgi:protein-serine/threonine kinase
MSSENFSKLRFTNSKDLESIEEETEPCSSILDMPEFSPFSEDLLDQLAPVLPEAVQETQSLSRPQSYRAARAINIQMTSDFIKTIQVAYENFWEAIEKNLQEEVKAFLDIPDLDINATGLNKWTALHIAASKGYKPMTALLLSRESNVNAKTSMNRTALHLSCIHNHLKVVKLLVRHKCELNLQDNDDNTALHYAASLGFEDIVEFLLQNGAQVNIFNNLKRTPADLSLNLETFQLFLVYHKTSEIQKLKTGYSRTCFGNELRHNSREDHVNQMIIKAKIVHSQEDLQLFNNRPRLDSKKRMSVPLSEVGPKDFNHLLLLGKGSFGSVYLVEKADTKEKFALKVLDKLRIRTFCLEKYAFTERNILMRLDSPFVVKLHYAFQTKEKMALVMDFCPHGDLSMILKRETCFSEDLTRFYACEILLGLEALHKADIIFRDLKPDNVLIDTSGHIKLADFGLSKENAGFKTLNHSFCGSPLYLAPEMISKKGHDRAIDWYIFGVIIFEMLHGNTPFFATEKNLLFKRIQMGKVNFKPGLSEDVMDLIKKLLEKNPKKRLGSGINGSDDIKAHLFFKDVDWNNVAELKVTPPPVKTIPRYETWISWDIVYGDLGEEETGKIDNWSILETGVKIK